MSIERKEWGKHLLFPPDKELINPLMNDHCRIMLMKFSTFHSSPSWSEQVSANRTLTRG